MVKTRFIKEVQIPKRFWEPIKLPKRPFKVEGWDSETYPEGHKFQGRTFLLTHYDGFEEELFIVRSKEDIINWFFRPGNRSIHFFYNLRFDAESLLKWFGKGTFFKVLSNSAEPTEIAPGIFCKYITDKCLILAEKKEDGQLNNPMKIFDIAQFYDRRPLRDVASIVGMKKIDEDSIVDMKRYDADKEYQERYNRYAIIDAVICQKLAQRFYQMVQQIVPVKNFYSTASIGKQFVLGQGIDREINLPKKVVQWSLLNCSGARIECGKRGYFEKAYKIDIVSAYPSSEVKLVSMKNMDWSVVDDMHEDCIYGFYCVDTETYDEKFALLPDKENNPLSYPIGKRRNEFITKQELIALRKRGFKVKVHGGIEGYSENPVLPFDVISKIFDQRAEIKRQMKLLEDQGEKETDLYVELDLKQQVLKIIMNSIYGCFLQLTPNTKVVEWTEDLDLEDIAVFGIFDENMIELVKVWGNVKWLAGNMFNPIYGADILANTRVKLYETVYNNNLEENVVFFATDAIALDKRPTQIPFGKKLGDWDLDLDGKKMAVVGSGVYYYEKEKTLSDGSKKTVGVTTQRGYKKTIHNVEKCKYCSKGEQCKYFDFKNIREVQQKFEIKDRPLHAAMAIRQDRFEEINLFRPDEKTFNLNFDEKRVWDRKFKNANEIWSTQIDSKPLVKKVA